MRRTLQHIRVLSLLALCVVVSACGQSGDSPPQLPEMRFEIAPQLGGTAQFEVVDVQAGGQRFTSLAGRTITTAGRFNIFVENAMMPFAITVRLVGSEPIEVRFGQAGVSNDTTLRVVDTPGQSVLVGMPSSTLMQASPEVRVDVCAPQPQGGGCSPFDTSGVAGVAISGSIGDTEATRLIGRFSNDEPEVDAPSVYFYANARDSVAAIVRANDHRFLQLWLYINGALEDDDASTGDVVVRSDL
jgi:hypothetical protein